MPKQEKNQSQAKSEALLSGVSLNAEILKIDAQIEAYKKNRSDLIRLFSDEVKKYVDLGGSFPAYTQLGEETIRVDLATTGMLSIETVNTI